MRFLSHPAFRVISWLALAAVVCALAAMFATRHWGGVATLGVFAAGGAAMLRWDRQLPPGLHALILGAAVMDGAGFVYELFGVGLFDELAHAYTALAVSLSAGFLFYAAPMRRAWRRHPLHLFIAVASFGLAVGGAWEVAEWVFGALGGVRDTAIDLAMDAFGAACAGAIAIWLVYRSPADAAQPRWVEA